MTKFFAAIICLLSVHFAAVSVTGEEDFVIRHAIDLAQEEAIDRNPSTLGMVTASNEALVHWNELLNLNYQALMAQLDADAQAKLRASQKQWITWRDLETEALGAIYGAQDGTIWRTFNAYAVMELTKKRALRLGFLRNLGWEGSFTFDVLGKPVAISETSNSSDIKAAFRIVAPSALPSVDNDQRLQYDLALVPDQGSASFVFDFADDGIVKEIIIDAFTKEQNPSVEKLISDLNQTADSPVRKGSTLVWQNSGWTFTHKNGGEGEDSTYMMRIKKFQAF